MPGRVCATPHPNSLSLPLPARLGMHKTKKEKERARQVQALAKRQAKFRAGVHLTETPFVRLKVTTLIGKELVPSGTVLKRSEVPPSFRRAKFIEDRLGRL